MTHRFLFLIVLITVASIAASAQEQDPVMTRPQFRPFDKIAPVKLPVRPTTGFGCSPIIGNWYQEGTLLGSNSLGKLYRMPVDNSLCLVPDIVKTTRMPVKKTRMPEQMPNAFLRRNEQGRR